MSVLFLPRIKYMGPLGQSCPLCPAPSTACLVAMSPVLNHFPPPSSAATNSSDVAFSLRQYSEKTVGPRSCISPSLSIPSLSTSSPTGITSCVSLSTSRACTKGNGHPTLPSTLSWESKPQLRAMPTSVIPYRSSRMLPPLSSVHAFFIGVGSADEPDMFNRRFLGANACLVAPCIGGDNFSWEPRKRLYIVGTAVKNVIGSLLFPSGRKGAANRSQTASILNGNINSIVDPAKRGVKRALTVPWMWWRGRIWRRWSCAV